MKFTTKDKDNDKLYSNCAEKGPYGNRGGWWYNACTRSNLNGLNYAEGTAIDEWIGIYWYKFGGSRNSMKTVTMSVIPKNPCMYHLNFTTKTLKSLGRLNSGTLDITSRLLLSAKRL